MFKQLILTLSLISIFTVVSSAQEKPETDKNKKMECSKESSGCCSNKEMKSSLNDEESKETSSVIPWNKVCPVKGEEIDADAPTVEYNGKIYGFCCPGCDAKFQKDPEKYLKNLNEDGSEFIGKS